MRPSRAHYEGKRSRPDCVTWIVLPVISGADLSERKADSDQGSPKLLTAKGHLSSRCRLHPATACAWGSSGGFASLRCCFYRRQSQRTVANGAALSDWLSYDGCDFATTRAPPFGP